MLFFVGKLSTKAAPKITVIFSPVILVGWFLDPVVLNAPVLTGETVSECRNVLWIHLSPREMLAD
jgi:hypothetical protein